MVGVRQGYLLSPVLFNIFLERIMQETLDDHHTSISIGGRPVCNLRFADDIDLIGGSDSKLQDLTSKLAANAKAYGMEISTEKSKVMVNSRNNVTANITMDGKCWRRCPASSIWERPCQRKSHVQQMSE